jgi:hypothetical protein
VGPEPGGPDTLPLEWDGRLDDLGVRLERTAESPAWRLVTAEYWDPQQADGKHNVFFTALNEDGTPAQGVRFTLDWVGRQDHENPCVAATDAEGKANCPLFTMLHTELKDGISFATTVDEPGDRVDGMGLPFNHHVCYLLTYRRTVT